MESCKQRDFLCGPSAAQNWLLKSEWSVSLAGYWHWSLVVVHG